MPRPDEMCCPHCGSIEDLQYTALAWFHAKDSTPTADEHLEPQEYYCEKCHATVIPERITYETRP